MDIDLRPTRRAYTRFELNTEGRLLLQEKEIPIVCRDISGKGLGAVSNESLTVNSKVKVKIFIPWLDNCKIEDGRVVWCKEVDKNYYQFGIELGIGAAFSLSS